MYSLITLHAMRMLQDLWFSNLVAPQNCNMVATDIRLEDVRNSILQHHSYEHGNVLPFSRSHGHFSRPGMSNSLITPA